MQSGDTGEQDRMQLTRVIWPMLGFKSFWAVTKTPAGI